MEDIRSVDPTVWFMIAGLISVAIARYATKWIMPPWVAFCLQWGGWALFGLALAEYFRIIEFLDIIPI
jgi:hypothetical protein